MCFQSAHWCLRLAVRATWPSTGLAARLDVGASISCTTITRLQVGEGSIYLFVAIVPVTMDALFKYWIFKGPQSAEPRCCRHAQVCHQSNGWGRTRLHSQLRVTSVLLKRPQAQQEAKQLSGVGMLQVHGQALMRRLEPLPCSWQPGLSVQSGLARSTVPRRNCCSSCLHAAAIHVAPRLRVELAGLAT